MDVHMLFGWKRISVYLHFAEGVLKKVSSYTLLAIGHGLSQQIRLK